MKSKQQLLEELLVERLDNRWWSDGPTPAPRVVEMVHVEYEDDDLAIARRRRDLDRAIRGAS